MINNNINIKLNKFYEDKQKSNNISDKKKMEKAKSVIIMKNINKVARSNIKLIKKIIDKVIKFRKTLRKL